MTVQRAVQVRKSRSVKGVQGLHARRERMVKELRAK